MAKIYKISHSLPTLALSTNEPVSFSAGTGVATCCIDAELGGVTVMRVRLTFINVWNERKENSRERGDGIIRFFIYFINQTKKNPCSFPNGEHNQ